MADLTTTEKSATSTSRARPPDPAAASPELAPVMKVTRAKATTSDAPRGVAQPRPARAGASGESLQNGPKPAASAVAPVDPATRPANVEIYQGGADTVTGDSVSVTQGGVTHVTAGTVEIQQGGIVNARADDISVRMGGVALARSQRLSVEMGGVGFALAREASLTQGGARTIVAQDIRVDQGLIGSAFAGKITFERPSGVFLLLAGKTEGPVKALMDWRGALAFGAAFGLLVGLLRRR